MHLLDNTLLQGGKYQIHRFISSGGFGCTYEAEHVLLEKRVAIKEFFVKDFCNRDETTSHVTVGTQSKKGLVEKMRLKFIDEAKSLCKLHHPGIVSVSDIFEENGTAYFVMDYIEGRSLREIVDQEGPLTEERAVRYIRQVAEALQHVHANNRLHLDIKPGNIMINSEDQPVLIDFGASKQYDELDGENTSTLLGKTPGYAPPEQMSNSVVKFLPATDIYALGATLYKLLTGITPLDVNLRISGEELAPLPASICETTRNTVSTAMEINKNKRPQSLAAFLSLLDTTLVSKDAKDETTIIEVNEKTEGATSTPNMGPKVPITKPTERKTPKPEPSVKVLPSEKPSFHRGIFVTVLCISVATIIGLLIYCTTPFSQSDSHSPSNTNAQTSSIPVESISLNKTDLTLKVGETGLLAVRYTPSHASDKTTIWESSKPNVAQVDSYGKVTAISPGRVVISANCNGKTVYCAVTVSANQISISSSMQSSQPIKETDTNQSGQSVKDANSKQSNQPTKGNTSSTHSSYSIPSKTSNVVNIPKVDTNRSDEIWDYIEQGEDDEDEPIPFQLVEEKPSFNGGDANEFSKWVNSRLVYPEIAKENGVQGRVTLQFTVNADGSVSNVKVLRSVDRVLDEEAVRVLSSSPKWKPGRMKGRLVKVTYIFPVIFQLK